MATVEREKVGMTNFTVQIKFRLKSFVLNFLLVFFSFSIIF